ncbi:Ger(x)C family spore germination protein [Bacillus sp. Marseille-P3661]|uniref:Ger(x)C family spore germination protein n=1 Tax=Bacillus sp. Marseille-P3661 TaxID=1936234 RepID=UPI000C81B18B|nr:Ger(x)C family spore germination protein [Bacillus sp. Marseille-P3661]
MKSTSILFILLSISLLLSGCYDKIELEQQSYVVALGLDQAAGKKGLFDITFQLANPEVGTSAQGGGADEPSRETVTLPANDFVTAKNTANSFVSRKITLDFAKVLVVSEELARSEEFLKIMETAARTKQLRENVSIIVSKEKASAFLKNNKPKTETRPHKYFQFMIERARETGIIPESTVHRFFQITEGDADLFLAIYATTEKNYKKDRYEDDYKAGEIPHKGGNNTEFMGSAVFKEGKMIDSITGEETRIANILDNTVEMQDVLATYPDPKNEKYQIAARFTKKEDTDIKVFYHKDKPSEIKVKVPIQIEILAVPSLIDYSSNKENRELLKQTIEKTLKKKYEEFIEKTQEEYKTEPFYWSLYIRKYFTSIEEYEQADWNKKIYPNANIIIEVELEKLKFGKLLRSTNFSEVQD